jgi:hypothetical protein
MSVSCCDVGTKQIRPRCCRSGGKVFCRKAKVSCKKATAKRATARKVDDNPKAHGAGHTRKLQSDEDAEIEV